jgi:hypothetical protein
MEITLERLHSNFSIVRLFHVHLFFLYGDCIGFTDLWTNKTFLSADVLSQYSSRFIDFVFNFTSSTVVKNEVFAEMLDNLLDIPA